MDDIDFIEQDIIKVKKSAHTRKVEGKKIRVRSSVEKARDDYKLAKREHKNRIKAIKAQARLNARIARNNVKAHRNMIATAKTTYKAIKLAGK